jgi:di/tripeptidase
VIRQFRRFSDPTITVEVIGDRPSAKLSPDHPLVKAAEGAILAAGYEKVSLEIGSTDANIPLVRGIPSVCIGITSGGDAHTTAEHIERGPVATGLVQLGLLTLVAATYCEAWSEWNLHSD